MNRPDIKATMLNFLQQLGDGSRVEQLRGQHMEKGYIYTWHAEDKRWYLQLDYSRELKEKELAKMN